MASALRSSKAEGLCRGQSVRVAAARFTSLQSATPPSMAPNSLTSARVRKESSLISVVNLRTVLRVCLIVASPLVLPAKARSMEPARSEEFTDG